jgi:hypothetical protein
VARDEFRGQATLSTFLAAIAVFGMVHGATRQVLLGVRTSSALARAGVGARRLKASSDMSALASFCDRDGVIGLRTRVPLQRV